MNVKGQYAYNGLQHVIWGQDTVSACVAEVERRGASNVAIISSPSLRRAVGTVDALADALGDKAALIFDELQPHTPAPQVAAFAKLLKDKNTDVVISLGGGTPIDTAKVALAMLDANATDPFAVANKPPKSNPPKIRQIACPTTLSGAEFSDLAGLTEPETKIKHGVASFGIGPATVILDAELAQHTPLDLWLSTGVRAVDHAIETLCSIEATPYTDALAAEALSKLADALRQTRRDPANLQARLDAQLAVWLASAGLDRTPYGASHGIGHQLGAVAGTPHGICSCILLPAVLEWNAEYTQPVQRRIANILEAESAADGVRQLLGDLQLPTRLSEADIQLNDLPEIAAGSVNNRWVKTNPRPLDTAQDIEQLLKTAF
ncbi:iron-containing alcohol dehydrogenase [Parasphingorhabdus sp.]|uniref:iron-containing alcohol dehydrogenase n=1 Tax=Parasphingorhabdus sp. TaxID=2709688 RepID=UPI003D2CCC0A